MSRLDRELHRIVDHEHAKPNTQAVLLGVQSRDGRIHFRGGAGRADPNARFCIASVSKMFTATVIMQLVDEQRLNLDTTAQTYLPHIDLSDLHIVNRVAQGGALTVRHLIHQTSGLADYYEAGVVDRLKQGIDARHTLADVLQMTKHLPPQAAPDSGKSHYSDTNYQLLGAIIAAVTGQPFHDVVQDRICAPLGLTETEVYQTNIQNAADILPIFYKGTELRIPLALSSMGPDGGVVSTLNDLLIFLRAYHAGQLFDPQNHSSIQHWTPLFFPLHYGYGLMRFKLPRWMTLFRKTPALIGHSGSTGSFAFYAPQSDIFLAGTFNQIGQSRRPFGVMLRVLRSVQRVAGTG